MKVYDGHEARNFDKRLAERHNRTIAKREKEIEVVDKLYDKKVHEAKVQNEKELLDIRDRNAERLKVDFSAQQKKLDDYQKSLKDTTALLEKQKLDTIDTHRDNLAELGKYYDSKFKTKHLEGQIKTKEMQGQIQDAVNRVQIETETNLQKIDQESKQKFADSLARTDAKLAVQSRNSTIKQNQADFEHAEIMTRKMDDHQKQMWLLERQQKAQKQEALDADAVKLKTQQEQQKQILKQEEVAFKEKFAQMQLTHQLAFDNLKQRFAKELDDLTQSHSKDKKFLVDRSIDNFYTIDRMVPEIQEFQDEKGTGGYLFALKVPPHEMESVNLSAHDRKIKINYSRRHSGRSEDVDGGINLAKRSETITREFQVNDIVDPNTITQKYEAGKLIYKIAKK